MASLPIFITSVANSSDDPIFPILFTWSTQDAQIKEVLLIPDDDWLIEASVEPNTLSIEEHQLYEFGFEASDVLAEWTVDFDTDVVYALDPQLVADLIEKTYDCKRLDPSFEVESVHKWFADQGVDIDYEIDLLDLAVPLRLLPPDELIAQLLQIAYQHQLIELDLSVNHNENESLD